ncbi:MAG: hypothetical protein KJ732_01610, partial [Candidatus Margulisbacteria bacterium]|nr:hypothetical protein [Candidatus Margulisiibacteriota bacterium]
MKIGIDIDNVIADTFADLIPHYNQFMGREETPQEVIETMRRRKFKMMHYFFVSWRKQVMTKISLIKGAAETIKHWHGDHHIKLVTSRWPIFNRQTRWWLNQHGIPYHELHYVKEKTKYKKAANCSLFIEDNLDECKILANYCERVLLFDQP